MSDRKVIFRDHKPFLHTEDNEPVLFIRDITGKIPLHDNSSYDKKELKELLGKLLEKKDSYTSKKTAFGFVRDIIKEYEAKEISLKEFMNYPIGYATIKRTKEVDTLLPYMGTQVELEKGTLFKDVWSLISKDSEVLTVIFAEQLGRFDIQIYTDHAKIPYEKSASEIAEEKIGEGMLGLECYWANTYQLEGMSYFGAEFHGYGITRDKYVNKGEPYETGFSLTFSSINSLMEYPLRLDESFEIKLKHLGKKDGYGIESLDEPIITKKEWTIYDMIGAILFEISWMGTPENQDMELDSLKETMDDVREFFDKTVEENEKELEHGKDDPDAEED